MKKTIIIAISLIAISLAAQAEEIQVDYTGGVNNWENFKHNQPTVCDPSLDSFEVLQKEKTEYVALVLHGFTLYPHTMDNYVKIFSEMGMNVIVPRLTGHHTLEAKDLDNVKNAEWVKEAEEAFAIAKTLGKKVVVVGFSLGGLLASRLALEHPTEVEALFLFAPALRMTQLASEGAMLGTLLGGMSLNQLHSLPVGCATPYYSSKAGHEIERLMINTELKFEGNYPEVDTTAYWKLNMPIFMGVVKTDTAVNTNQLAKILRHSPSKLRGYFYLDSGSHGTWLEPGVMELASSIVGYDGGANLAIQMKSFWKDAQGL